MKAHATKFTKVSEYFAAQPSHIQALLQQVRTTIANAAPGAEEVISYGMPAFRLHGMLVFYAAAKKHIGFYPTPAGIEAFREELAGYKTSKGAIQFPLDEPLPLALIAKIVQFRVKENKEEYAIKLERSRKKR